LYVFAARIKQSDVYTTNSVFVKIDTSGSELWMKDIPDAENFLGYGTSFVALENGHFITSGTGIVVSDPLEFGQGPAIIGKFDSSGNTIYMRSFYEPGYKVQECLFDMIPTSDGIAAVGFASAPQTPWMIKIDSNLCFGPDSCGPNLPVSNVPDYTTPQQALLLPYPNPSPDGRFSIRLPQALSEKTALRPSQRPNMMDPLGSHFSHIHRDLSMPARKKAQALSIHPSDSHLIQLRAFDLQGKEIPMEYSIQNDLVQVKINQGSATGMLVLKMQIGEAYWYGKVWVE
jgi:hypothetical protein